MTLFMDLKLFYNSKRKRQDVLHCLLQQFITTVGIISLTLF